MTTDNIQRVQTLFSRCLDTAQEMGRDIDPENVHLGDHECEPFYAVEVAGRMLVLEGDYKAALLRVRTLDGEVLATTNALAPTALALEVLMAWSRAEEWAPPQTDRGGPRHDDPETSPAPLDGPISRMFLGLMAISSWLLPVFDSMAPVLSA